MKLKSYFDQLSEERLSDEEKVALYQRICEKKSRVSQGLLRGKVFTKKKVRPILFLVLVFSCFGILFGSVPKLTEYRAFWTEKNSNGVNIANADYIAEVIEVNGDYIIEKEGKTFQNSVLFDGDLITLKSEAKIIFNINDHIKTEIQGPAKFTISKIGEGKYYLFLIEGNFLKVDSEKTTDILQVETDEIMIETTEDEKVALTLVRTDKKTELENKGASLFIKDKSTQEDNFVLETEKLLTMDVNDITYVKDLDEFATILAGKRNLTYTTALEKDETSSTNIVISHQDEVIQKDDIGALIDINDDFLSSKTDIYGETENDISNDLAYNSDEKIVPTEIQLGKVTAALNSKFLLGDIKELYLAKQIGDKSETANAYKNLLLRIKSVGDVCGVNVSLNTTFDNIISQIDAVNLGMNKYHFPPSKQSQLITLKNWINYIESHTLDQNWDDFINTLPGYLEF